MAMNHDSVYQRITEAIRRGTKERLRPEVIAHVVLNIVDPVENGEEGQS